MWAHEFSFKPWKEDPAPIIEAVRGYLETDYDFNRDISRVGRDLETAKADVMEGVPAGPVGSFPADVFRIDFRSS